MMLLLVFQNKLKLPFQLWRIGFLNMNIQILIICVLPRSAWRNGGIQLPAGQQTILTPLFDYLSSKVGGADKQPPPSYNLNRSTPALSPPSLHLSSSARGGI